MGKGKGWFVQQIGLGKMDIHTQKNDIGPLPYTLHNYHLKQIKT